LKTFVEGGGRALFLLDTPLRLGDSEPPSENPDLEKLLDDWGVTPNKDLALDLSGVGRLFGVGPEVPVIVGYESHPITEPLTRVPHCLSIGSVAGYEVWWQSHALKAGRDDRSQCGHNIDQRSRSCRSDERKKRAADAGRGRHA